MTTNQPRNDTFERILGLEQAVRVTSASAGFGATLDIRARGERNLRQARKDLSAAIDALTTEQARAYGAYRKAALRVEG
jgi:hypothetical protein